MNEVDSAIVWLVGRKFVFIGLSEDIYKVVQLKWIIGHAKGETIVQLVVICKWIVPTAPIDKWDTSWHQTANLHIGHQYVMHDKSL